MLNMIFGIVTASMACSAISVTLTKSHLGGWLRKSALKLKKPWLDALMGCHYCMSHWVAALMVAVMFGSGFYAINPVLSYIFSVFTLVGLSGIISGIIVRLQK